tara:strand:- start:347 stop:532 length:186 start_codon:yes stop_codon:yes gene_type:complete
MKKTNTKIINKIEIIRSKNNKNWMNIMRLALKYAPNQTKKIMIKINSSDKKISKLIGKLSK